MININDLQENKLYHIKLERLYEPRAKVIWEGEATLGLQRNKKGEIVIICPYMNKRIAWAEYSPRDYDPHWNCFVVEDYSMQITELNS